jgi:hypothetical protein
MEYFAGLDVSMEETHVSSALLIETARLFLKPGHQPRPRQSPPPWQKGRPLSAFYSRRAAWPRCSFMA